MALWRLRQRQKTKTDQAHVYSRWDGTQAGFDPSALDILAELRDDLLYHGDPMSALRRMLRHGFEQDGERIVGLQEIMERLRQRRQELLSEHKLDGFYDDVAKELRDIVEAERQNLENLGQPASGGDVGADGDADDETGAGDAGGGEAGADDETGEGTAAGGTDATEDETPDNFHRIAKKQLQLDMLPPDLAGQLRQLENYEFTSHEAERRFYELLSELRQQLMENMVSQLTQQVENMTPGDMSRINEMMSELNKMLEQRERGEEPDFQNFMDRFGDFFPENPQSLDELLENLAQRMAAMQALMNSMSDEQRAQMDQLAQQLLGDMDFNWQVNQLAQNLQQMFPGQGWGSGYDFSGVDPLNFPDAMSMMSELGDIDQLENLLQNARHPGALADVDIERAKQLLDDESAHSLQQLSQLAKKLEEEGLIENVHGEYELTPKAIRRLGQHALADLFARLSQDRFGGHEHHTTGQSHEKEFTTKPYEWGDPFNLHIERTIRNAIVRGSGERAASERAGGNSGAGGSVGTGTAIPIRLTPEDFEIEQSENLVRSSTVLLLDLSLSMPMRGNFLPAKKVATALGTLIATKFPRDYLGIVTFSDIATEIKVQDLPSVQWDYVHGTNMQHALMLARQMLSDKSGFRQIIMITDGEPTAHLTSRGEPRFAYPPTRETVDKTLAEVMRCTKQDIRINVFMLDATEYLAHFVEQITRMNKGRAFYTTPDNLGDYVLVDFVDHKRSLFSQGRHF